MCTYTLVLGLTGTNSRCNDGLVPVLEKVDLNKTSKDTPTKVPFKTTYSAPTFGHLQDYE